VKAASYDALGRQRWLFKGVKGFMFGFPLDSILFLWIIPFGLAIVQLIYAYGSGKGD
jgi:hypothetical protein